MEECVLFITNNFFIGKVGLYTLIENLLNISDEEMVLGLSVHTRKK